MRERFQRGRDVFGEGGWWRALALVPLVELLWLVVSAGHSWYARAVGIAGQQYFGVATDGLVVAGLLLSAFAPLALTTARGSRRAPSGRLRWRTCSSSCRS